MPGSIPPRFPQQRPSANGGAHTTTQVRLTGVPICPDLLDHSMLGEADGLRGRVVRVFFTLLRLWP